MISSALCAAALGACVSLALATRAPIALDVNVSAPAVAHAVSPSYISFNFDFHLNTEFGWVNASVLRDFSVGLNLSDPALRTLTAALAPAHLRIGGSQEDMVVYNVKGWECEQASTEFANTTFCLTMERWAELNAFAAATGVTIAYGLNCMTGRNKSGGGFNSTNLENFLACAWGARGAPARVRGSCARGRLVIWALLCRRWWLRWATWLPSRTPHARPTRAHPIHAADTAAHENSVYAFEFGNEKQTTIPAAIYAADVLRVRAVIDSLWPTPAQRPILVANDENPDVGEAARPYRAYTPPRPHRPPRPPG